MEMIARRNERLRAARTRAGYGDPALGGGVAHRDSVQAGSATSLPRPLPAATATGGLEPRRFFGADQMEMLRARREARLRAKRMSDGLAFGRDQERSSAGPGVTSAGDITQLRAQRAQRLRARAEQLTGGDGGGKSLTLGGRRAFLGQLRPQTSIYSSEEIAEMRARRAERMRARRASTPPARFGAEPSFDRALGSGRSRAEGESANTQDSAALRAWHNARLRAGRLRAKRLNAAMGRGAAAVSSVDVPAELPARTPGLETDAQAREQPLVEMRSSYADRSRARRAISRGVNGIAAHRQLAAAAAHEPPADDGQERLARLQQHKASLRALRMKEVPLSWQAAGGSMRKGARRFTYTPHEIAELRARPAAGLLAHRALDPHLGGVRTTSDESMVPAGASALRGHTRFTQEELAEMIRRRDERLRLARLRRSQRVAAKKEDMEAMGAGGAEHAVPVAAGETNAYEGEREA